MVRTSQVKRVVVTGVLVLAASGCNGGGGSGLFGLFGESPSFSSISSIFGGNQSSSGSDAPPVLASIAGDVSSTSTSTLTGSTVAQAAVVHNPEPASMALFGTGLVAAAVARRKRARRQVV